MQYAAPASCINKPKTGSASEEKYLRPFFCHCGKKYTQDNLISAPAESTARWSCNLCVYRTPSRDLFQHHWIHHLNPSCPPRKPPPALDLARSAPHQPLIYKDENGDKSKSEILYGRDLHEAPGYNTPREVDVGKGLGLELEDAWNLQAGYSGWGSLLHRPTIAAIRLPERVVLVASVYVGLAMAPAQREVCGRSSWTRSYGLPVLGGG
ncbi:hypothetical protein F5144DRAFT_603205 [Chaetomium tenue]|uniref:Uncharacterized protein n=1 Tax=Chaetomium tenue TaxID=1854479 RepID=A0ACB7PE37_9PEZI|nr:hypothetical protein F5144DRAFT_603205 [Chaetomium globosum]